MHYYHLNYQVIINMYEGHKQNNVNLDLHKVVVQNNVINKLHDDLYYNVDIKVH